MRLLIAFILQILFVHGARQSKLFLSQPQYIVPGIEQVLHVFLDNNTQQLSSQEFRKEKLELTISSRFWFIPDYKFKLVDSYSKLKVGCVFWEVFDSQHPRNTLDLNVYLENSGADRSLQLYALHFIVPRNYRKKTTRLNIRKRKWWFFSRLVASTPKLKVIRNVSINSSYDSRDAQDRDQLFRVGQYFRKLALNQKRMRHDNFERAKECFSQNRHSCAKNFSVQGRYHDALAKEFDSKAFDSIFKANNNNNSGDISLVDLHGLFVSEASGVVRELIEKWQVNKAKGQMKIIVGKGIHSSDGAPKLKPAIVEILREHNLEFKLADGNEGCIIVYL